MKNRFRYILLSICLACLTPSCSDWLEIKPLDDIVLEDFWKNSSDVEAVVRSCYRAMLENDYMARIIIGGELRSDNMVMGRGSVDDANEKRNLEYIEGANIQPSNPFAKWGSFYSVINYCNTVLRYAPGVVDIDPDYTAGMLRANEAEALTLRALSYFYLVRLYRDVPYITEPSVDDTQEFQVPKDEEGYILAQLEADLLKAEVYALKQWPKVSQTKGRVTKNTVRALLADIYLWQSKYDQCIAMCNKILAEVVTEKDILGGMELTAHDLRLVKSSSSAYIAKAIFNQGNSTESIFELQFDQNDKKNDKIYDFYGTETKSGELSAAPFADWKLFSTIDVRGKDSFTPEELGYYNIFKYVGDIRATESGSSTTTYLFRSSASSTPNWIIYRLTDIMLMKAEALTELDRVGKDGKSTLEEALELVNEVYLRSNPGMPVGPYTLAEYGQKDLMQALVLEERQREFLFEGKRWFDLLRLAKRDGNSNRLLSYVLRKYLNQDIVKSKLSIMDALYMPVHSDELNSNPKLTQNPFYETNLN